MPPRAGRTTYSQYSWRKAIRASDLIEAGLASERDDGSLYDRFRHRVMFPIRDGRGRMAGFGARAIDPEDMPKYLNSPQTALFDKSSLLYGLDKARRSIRTEDQAVIVEGYLDVIAPYQAGFTNLVSTMGTAMTEAQLRQIKRLTRKIVLALDADAAGRESNSARAAGRPADARPGDRDRLRCPRACCSPKPGCKADIRVSTLPDGLDPDEVVQQNPQQWADLIDQAKPIVEHVMRTLAAGYDINDPKVKTEIAGQVLPLIQDLPNAIERDAYLQQLARLLKVDERSLLSLHQPAKSKPVRRQPAIRPGPGSQTRQDDSRKDADAAGRRPGAHGQQPGRALRLDPDAGTGTDLQTRPGAQACRADTGLDR